MRLAVLGSGSRGNAYLVEAGHTRVLIDCGFTLKEIKRRLGVLGVEPESLSAILVTHEHGDHVRGLGPLARAYGLATWMTKGTTMGIKCGDLPDAQHINCHSDSFEIGDLRILPYPVPHDAREPCQFVVEWQGKRLGLLTDTGHITPHIIECLYQCDALVLEFNHERGMLLNGPYPPALQARVGGMMGHLSNNQAMGLLGSLDVERLQFLIAAHISENNNTLDQVRSTVAVNQSMLLERLKLAEQDHVSDWYDVN